MNRIIIVILGFFVTASFACDYNDVYSEAIDTVLADSANIYKKLYHSLLTKNDNLVRDTTLRGKELGRLRKDASENQQKIQQLEDELERKNAEIQGVKNNVNELIGRIEKILRNSDKYEDTTQTMTERKNKRMGDMLEIVNDLYRFAGKDNDKPEDIQDMLELYCGGVVRTQSEIDSIEAAAYERGYNDGFKKADSLWRIKYNKDIDSLKKIIKDNRTEIQNLQNQVGFLNSVIQVKDRQHSTDVATIERLEGEKKKAQAKIDSLEQDNQKQAVEIERRDAVINMRPCFEFDIKRRIFSDKLKIKKGETFNIPFVVNENEHMQTLKQYTIYFAIGESDVTLAAEGMKTITISNGKDKYIFDNENRWHDKIGNAWLYHAKCTFYWTGDKVEETLTITNATNSDVSIKGEDIKYYYLVFEKDKFIVGYTQCTINNPIGTRIKE